VHSSANSNARAAIGLIGFVAAVLGGALAHAADKVISGVGGNYLTQVLQRFGWLNPAGGVRDFAWLLLLVGILVVGSIAVPAAASLLGAVRRAAKPREPPATRKLRADAFICASSKDTELAETVCDALERDGVSCWLPKRDLVDSRSEGEQLADAIRASGVVLLLLTKHVNDDAANGDTGVQDDVGYAHKHNVRIFPLRFEDVEPVGSLDRMTVNMLWFDGTQRPLERTLKSLAPRVRALLADAGIPLERSRDADGTARPAEGSGGVALAQRADEHAGWSWKGFGRILVRLWSGRLGVITDERDVEEFLQLPVLASIPFFPRTRAITPALRNAALESYFQLVLAMRYNSDYPLRSVTITSPLKGDGKSIVAMNVAGAFGEIAISSIERDVRVLVIDADMRRSSLHRKFDVSNDIGLSDILIGRAPLSACVKRTDRPGVDLLTSGTRSPNPLKLLQSGRFDSLLREARDQYQMVIVDAPAVVPVFDAAILATKTDGTVMVVSAGHTDVLSTRRALARLDSVGTVPLGVVVNRSTARVDDHSDYFAGR